MKELIGEDYLCSPQKERWEKMTAAAVYGIGFPLEKIFAHILPHETGNEPYFVQERYGDPNADPIDVKKLVTLIGAITNGSSATGMRHDRAGKCGDLVRKLRFDELPQLIEVLKGIMALIGPRAVTETDIKKYYAAIEEPKRNRAYQAGTSPGLGKRSTHRQTWRHGELESFAIRGRLHSRSFYRCHQ